MAVFAGGEWDQHGDGACAIHHGAQGDFRGAGVRDAEGSPVVEPAAEFEVLFDDAVGLFALGEGKEEVRGISGGRGKDGCAGDQRTAVQHVFEQIVDAIAIGVGGGEFLGGVEGSETIDPRGEVDRAIGGDDE